MKNILMAVCAMALSVGCINDTSAQCCKQCKDCKSHTNTTVINKAAMQQHKTLSCKLTTPELRKRKEEVIDKLKKLVLERKELANGYSYKFTGTDQALDMLAEFIKSERQCCDFFNFKLNVTNDSFIWLEISGDEAAKEFIVTELEM